MNYSKQRNLILATIQNGPHHPTAEQVYEQVHKQDAHISLATVYRNLNQLAENDIIKKIDHLDNQAHFDHTLSEHYHFICSECSAIIDIDCNIVSNLKQHLLTQDGLSVDKIELSFHGLCPECQKKNITNHKE